MLPHPSIKAFGLIMSMGFVAFHARGSDAPKLVPRPIPRTPMPSGQIRPPMATKPAGSAQAKAVTIKEQAIIRFIYRKEKMPKEMVKNLLPEAPAPTVPSKMGSEEVTSKSSSQRVRIIRSQAVPPTEPKQ